MTVRVDFVSGNPASRWDVYADDAQPRADLMPEDGGMMLARARPHRLLLGPGVIAGTF